MPEQEQENRFFNLSIDMLCIARFSGYFFRLNPEWEKTLGFSRDELMSRPMFDFVHREDRDRTLDQNRAVRTGGEARGFENRYLCKDGSYKWLRWNARADIDRKLIYSVARDITSGKRTEEDRQRLVREWRSPRAKLKVSREILPICMYCKNIRDDENHWHSVEAYISANMDAKCSHGICPTCYKQVTKGWDLGSSR